MKRQRVYSYLAVAVGLLVVLGVLAGIKGMQIGALIAAGEDRPEPEETVAAHAVQTQELERSLRALGTVEPVSGVQVAADLPGLVREIAFVSGAQVDAGELLVRQDVSVEQAELESAEASARLAELNLKRARDLYANDAIPAAERDSAEASFLQAQAQVGAIRATIDRKTVRAPFAGRLGARQVQLGQFLNSGTPVVSLQALERVYIDFSLPQQRLSQVDSGMEVRVLSDAFPGEVFRGEVTTVEPAIDSRTRNLRIQSTFENSDERLRPGMFVQVELVLPESEAVKLIPATSVVYAPYGDSVFVVEDREDGAQIVRQRFVRVGRAHGDFVVVAEGVEEGELVVSDGAFKLRNDLKVRIDNDKAPKPELEPQPDEA